MSGWSPSAPLGISVVVISRNEGRELARTVENFDDTLPAGAEVIVIDDGSTDGSANRVKTRRGRIKVHPCRELRRRAREEPRRPTGARPRHRLCRRAPAAGAGLVAADARRARGPKVGGVAPAITGFKGGRLGYGLTFRNASLEVRWRRRKPRGPAAAPIIPGCCFATRTRRDRGHGRLGRCASCNAATSTTKAACASGC